MLALFLVCPACERRYPLPAAAPARARPHGGGQRGRAGGGRPRFRCACGSSLTVSYGVKRLARTGLRGPIRHARYLPLFPVPSLVSLQEGGTPLLRLERIERALGLRFRLYAKNEALNPTGSFKDRGSSVEVANAVRCRAKQGAVASTGNMGASLAAYCARAGLPLSVYTPADTPRTKLEQIIAHGATVFHVRQPYSRVVAGVERLWEQRRAFLLGDYVYRREGTKSIGFEIAEQLPGADHVIVPVGNGILLAATGQAFRESRALGLLRRFPKLTAVQAGGCRPFVEAARRNRPPVRAGRGKTAALAIECDFPLDWFLALRALRESRGDAVSVPDRAILRARDLLARREGLFAEPAGAAALAGVLADPSRYGRGSSVVCLLTGHGLKAPHEGLHARIREAAAVGRGL